MILEFLALMLLFFIAYAALGFIGKFALYLLQEWVSCKRSR